MKKKIVFGLVKCICFLLFCLFVLNETAYAKDKVVIVIDPGHGGKMTPDKEKNGAEYNDELYEKEVNLITARALKNELEEYNNTEVYLTRNSDVSMGISERIAYAQSVKADVVISCHYNSANHLFFGGEIYTSAYGNCYMTGNGMAQCIARQWENDGLVYKGTKTKINTTGADYYGIIRKGTEVGLPVIILEHGYLDNKNDYARLGTVDDWMRMGRLDAVGIAEYYGLSKENSFDEIEPTVNVNAPDLRVEPDTTAPTGVSLEIVGANAENGEVNYEISAIEPDGNLMYYGLAIIYSSTDEDFNENDETDDESDEDNVKTIDIRTEISDFDELLLWEDGETTMKGTFSVPSSFKGYVVGRVYNSYELYSESEPIAVDMSMLPKESENDDVENVESEGYVATGGAVMIYPHGGTAAADPRVSDAKDTFSLGGNKITDNDKTTNFVLGVRNKALFGLVVVCAIVAVLLVTGIVIFVMKVIVPRIRQR